MAGAIPASPAVLPLPGGQEGATTRVHPLLCGQIAGPEGWFNGPPGLLNAPKALGIGVPRERWLAVPVIAFLIEHPGAGPIMVDTGFHASVLDARARRRNLGALGALMARDLKLAPEHTAAAQLRALDIDPGDVPFVVMTHLHFDHASALADFPGATVIVSEQEWRAANTRGAATRGYCTAQLDPRCSYATLDFDSPAASAQGPFGQTYDLFGDGSLIALYTPGHSRGHMALLARLRAGQFLVAGDAIYTMATLREGKRPWRCEDPKAFERSLSSLQAYDKESANAVIVPGHDMAHWQTLKPLYE